MRFFEFVNEGVNDPAIFKAVFVIGGPGSGKSTVSDMLGLNALGFVNINSDLALTYLMTKNQLSLSMPAHEKEKREVVRGRAKEVTAGRMNNAIDGRLGLYIDGTGEDYSKIDSLRDNLMEIGYDTFLVVVNAPLEVAKKRNAQRLRKVPDEIVEKKWYGVQKNLERFLQVFENHVVINNAGTQQELVPQIEKAYKKIDKWSKLPIDNEIAKLWIKQQKKVDESIDVEKSFPIETWYEDDNTYADVAVAHDSEGRDIEVIFTPLHDTINAIDFDFTRGGTYEKTGEGEAGKVFATVLKAFDEYLHQINDPDYILFASKGGSRTSAYQALLRRFAHKYGYKVIPFSDLPDEIADQPQAEGHQFVLGRI